jgi:hypothetical protein
MELMVEEKVKKVEEKPEEKREKTEEDKHYLIIIFNTLAVPHLARPVPHLTHLNLCLIRHVKNLKKHFRSISKMFNYFIVHGSNRCNTIPFCNFISFIKDDSLFNFG